MADVAGIAPEQTADDPAAAGPSGPWLPLARQAALAAGIRGTTHPRPAFENSARSAAKDAPENFHISETSPQPEADTRQAEAQEADSPC